MLSPPPHHPPLNHPHAPTHPLAHTHTLRHTHSLSSLPFWAADNDFGGEIIPKAAMELGMSVQAYLFNGYWWAFWEGAQGGAGGAGWPDYCRSGRLWRGRMLCGRVGFGWGGVGWCAHTLLLGLCARTPGSGPLPLLPRSPAPPLFDALSSPPGTARHCAGRTLVPSAASSTPTWPSPRTCAVVLGGVGSLWCAPPLLPWPACTCTARMQGMRGLCAMPNPTHTGHRTDSIALPLPLLRSPPCSRRPSSSMTPPAPSTPPPASCRPPSWSTPSSRWGAVSQA